MTSMRYKHTTISLLISSILFLFFFQLLADFIAAIYAFGLMGLNLPPELACVLLLFSPLLLLFFRNYPSEKGMALLATAVLVSRALEVMLDTRGRMFVSGLGVAIFLIYLPAVLHHHQHEGRKQELAISLGLSVAISILLRVLGSGVDLSTVGVFRGIGWVLALIAGVFLWRNIVITTRSQQLLSSPGPTGVARSVKVIASSLGITAVLTLLYFAFINPSVIARWTGDSYLRILFVMILAWSTLLIGLARKPSLFARLKPGFLWAWNALFVLCLVLTIFAHQVHFPSQPESYPFAPASYSLAEIPLYLMLLLAPILLVDFAFFGQTILEQKPSIQLLAGSFAFSSLFLLVMIFAQVFTSVYDYIPMVGPFFRDKFWLVFLVNGLVLLLPALWVSKIVLSWVGSSEQSGLSRLLRGCMVLITVAILGGALLTASRPKAPSESEVTGLRLLTYNVQQGYSWNGQLSLDDQLAVIRQAKPDVVGLQESDTARIANGNNDLVRYFANRLHMYSYYGPSTVVGTFGIALLSRYPIQNPQTYYMYSTGEQTAVIVAQIAIGGDTYNLFITHLGNDGPLIQQEQVLQLVEGKENVLLMGDFNFRPGTDQYRMTTALLNDAWMIRWPHGNPSSELDPSNRIDYLFVSPGMDVIESQYLTGPQSDHPALVSEIKR